MRDTDRVNKMNSEEPRIYRNMFKSGDLTYFTVKKDQTDLCIGAIRNLSEQARESVLKYRKQVEEYIRRQPVFLHSLVPITPLNDAPQIVRHICQASSVVGVGPMAAVAGAFSYYVAMDLMPLSHELVVENGGDIYISSARTRISGIFAGKSILSGKIGLEIQPSDLPVAICTSSGTVGHSLSFGNADAVVILSKDACLADAAATAIGNIVKQPEDIEHALEKAGKIQGVTGAVIIVGDKLGAWGQVKFIQL